MERGYTTGKYLAESVGLREPTRELLWLGGYVSAFHYTYYIVPTHKYTDMHQSRNKITHTNYPELIGSFSPRENLSVYFPLPVQK